MSVHVRASNNTHTTQGTTSLVLTLPGTPQVGDPIIIPITTDTSTHTVTGVPSGWTIHYSAAVGTGSRHLVSGVYASGTTVTLTTNAAWGSSHMSAAVVVLDGGFHTGIGSIGTVTTRGVAATTSTAVATGSTGDDLLYLFHEKTTSQTTCTVSSAGGTPTDIQNVLPLSTFSGSVAIGSYVTSAGTATITATYALAGNTNGAGVQVKLTPVAGAAATATGSITITGSAAATPAATATGSITITGTATASGSGPATIKAVGTAVVGTAASFTVSPPAGSASGDYLVLFAACQSSASASDWDVSPVTGMARLGPGFTASDNATRVTGIYGVQLTAPAASSYTFTNPTNGSRSELVFLLLSNVATTPVSGYAAYSAQALALSSLTVSGFGTVGGDLTVQIGVASLSSPNSYAQTAYTGGLTEQVFAPNPSGTENTGVSRDTFKVWAGVAPSGGVTTHTWSLTGQASRMTSYLVSFASATPPPLAATATGMISITGTATPTTALAQWRAATPSWCAHRGGFYSIYGEFTLPSFTAQKGWNKAAAWNIDVFKTTDGEWVCSHDQTTGRVLSGTSLDIPSNTWASISGKTTLVGGNPATRIDDVVAIAPAGTIFFIDNKQNSFQSAFFTKLAALGLTPANTVIKNYIGSVGNITFSRSNGYQLWLYGFDADTATFATNSQAGDWVGFDYAATQANWNTVMAQGLPSLAHVLTSGADRITADTKAATAGAVNFGYMTSNPAALIPASPVRPMGWGLVSSTVGG